ncbi:MAG: DUF2334 domain-containing protein [Dehalococcoidia bacterium]|nr:DUF2334 domain-containing protein [Dehalococcoidia bacterium]
MKNATRLAFSSIMLLAFTSCSFFPGGSSAVTTITQAVQEPHTRRLETPDYVGNRGAIIFTLAHNGDDNLKETTDKIIRLFAEKEAPLDIALPPSNTGDYSNLIFLRPYIDAGVIDISVNGGKLNWLDTGTASTDPAYISLQNTLQQAKDRLKFIFGDLPVACLLPPEYYDQVNYSLLQDTGFKILPLPYEPYYSFSSKPQGWGGEEATNGLFRLPVIGTASYTSVTDERIPPSLRIDPAKTVLTDVNRSISDLGIAVIEIVPQDFANQENTPDSEKLLNLANLVQSCQQIGDIATFEGWYSYTSRWTTNKPGITRVLPPYNGGPAIIFRMDDVSVGWHEEVVEAIIKIFEKNGVPIDLGIVANVDGTKSYEMPWLKPYLEQGVIGISVHGYDWTYYQFDTSHDLESLQIIQGDVCSLYGAAEETPPPEETLTYAYIKLKLRQARDSYLQYFGIEPVALTVPTDYFDETGYRAISDAGFKIFATHITEEPHPSVITVDFFGWQDPNGMYRIPTASDVCTWENCTWGDIYDISDILSITGYCKYHAAWDNVVYNDFGSMVCGVLGTLDVAAVSIHPDAFVGIDGKPNQAKLDKLDIIVKWCKTITTLTTFEQWYNYTTSQK